VLLNRGTRLSGLDASDCRLLAGCSSSFASAGCNCRLLQVNVRLLRDSALPAASWRRRMLEFVVGCIVILIVFGLIWAGFLFLMSLYFEGEGRSRDR